MLGDLCRGGADPAPHSMDEYALACPEAASRHEGVVGSVKDFGNGACVGVRQLLRDWERLDIAHDQQLSLCAATHETHDAIPDSPSRNARTDRFDIARVFKTGDVGGPSGRSCITPLALIDVRSVEAGSSNSDSNLPLASGRGGRFLDSDDLRSAGGGVDDGSHESTLIPSWRNALATHSSHSSDGMLRFDRQWRPWRRVARDGRDRARVSSLPGLAARGCPSLRGR